MDRLQRGPHFTIQWTRYYLRNQMGLRHIPVEIGLLVNNYLYILLSTSYAPTPNTSAISAICQTQTLYWIWADSFQMFFNPIFFSLEEALRWVKVWGSNFFLRTSAKRLCFIIAAVMINNQLKSSRSCWTLPTQPWAPTGPDGTVQTEHSSILGHTTVHNLLCIHAFLCITLYYAICSGFALCSCTTVLPLCT